MAKNEFLTFGMAEGANVLSNEEYAALAARVNGFTAGVAKSRELNKAWRQSSIITHILAQYIADESGNDVLDNGDIDALKKSLAAAIKNALPEVRDATLTEKGIIQLSNATDSTSEKLAATPRAVKYAYDLANSANNNANTKLSKSQNGADIPDKNAFVKNLGLVETVNLAQGAYPGLKSVDVIPTLGYNGAFQGRAHTNYAKGISVGDSDYGQIWVNSSGRLFAQFSNNNGAKPGGECVYTDDIIVQKANNAVPSSRKINGKTLSGDVSLNAGDVGALPETVYVENIPTRRFVGAFSGGGGAGWVKGINIGTGGDTGQIYVNQYGELYAYFFNTNGEIDGGPVSNCPLGSPVPWPQPNPPSGYLACNGQTFNKSQYPQLAAAYPSGVLPDLRGEFIRGWDDGRGTADAGRGILSWQGDAFVSHKHGYRDRYYIENMNGLRSANKKEETPGGYNGNLGSGHSDEDNNGFLYIDSTTEKTGGNETRPRNIAFNYMVRAA